MGVYIKGLKVPDNCQWCPFNYDELDCCAGYHLKENINIYEGKRPDNCPLIPIPEPHGRLVEEHYNGELKAKIPQGVIIMYYNADEDKDRIIIEAEEVSK